MAVYLCNRCNGEITEDDVAAKKALPDATGLLFCLDCVAAIMAEHQVAPAPPPAAPPSAAPPPAAQQGAALEATVRHPAAQQAAAQQAARAPGPAVVPARAPAAVRPPAGTADPPPAAPSQPAPAPQARPAAGGARQTAGAPASAPASARQAAGRPAAAASTRQTAGEPQGEVGPPPSRRSARSSRSLAERGAQKKPMTPAAIALAVVGLAAMVAIGYLLLRKPKPQKKREPWERPRRDAPEDPEKGAAPKKEPSGSRPGPRVETVVRAAAGDVRRVAFGSAGSTDAFHDYYAGFHHRGHGESGKDEVGRMKDEQVFRLHPSSFCLR